MTVTPDEQSHTKLFKIKMKILVYLDLEFRTVVLSWNLPGRFKTINAYNCPKGTQI